MTPEDSIVNALYSDKRTLLTDQLDRITAELTERQGLHERASRGINHEASVLRDAIPTLTPEHGEQGDPHRQDRSRLELAWANLTREARNEDIMNWRDQQHLKTEARIVQRDLSAAVRQEERIKTLR